MSIFLKFNTHYKETYFKYYRRPRFKHQHLFLLLFSGVGVRVIKIQHTVHLWGFSPVWRLMCTTNMYWALNGFSSRLHSFQRQMNIFLLACMWSIFICYNIYIKINSIQWKVNSQNKHLMKLCTQTIHNTCIRNAKYTCICIWKFRYFNILMLYNVYTLLLSEFFFH